MSEEVKRLEEQHSLLLEETPNTPKEEALIQTETTSTEIERMEQSIAVLERRVADQEQDIQNKSHHFEERVRSMERTHELEMKAIQGFIHQLSGKMQSVEGMRREEERKQHRKLEQRIEQIKQEHTKEKLEIEMRYQGELRRLKLQIEEIKDAEQEEQSESGELIERNIWLRSENSRLIAELARYQQASQSPEGKHYTRDINELKEIIEGIRDELGDIKASEEEAITPVTMSFGYKTGVAHNSPKLKVNQVGTEPVMEEKKEESPGSRLNIGKLKNFISKLETQFEGQLSYIRELEEKIQNGKQILTCSDIAPSLKTSSSFLTGGTSRSNSRSPTLTHKSPSLNRSPFHLHHKVTVASTARAKASSQTRKALASKRKQRNASQNRDNTDLKEQLKLTQPRKKGKENRKLSPLAQRVSPLKEGKRRPSFV